MFRQWAPAWSCGVLFSDNAAGFAAAKQAADRAGTLQAQRAILQERLSTTGRACQVCLQPDPIAPLLE